MISTSKTFNFLELSLFAVEKKREVGGNCCHIFLKKLLKNLYLVEKLFK